MSSFKRVRSWVVPVAMLACLLLIRRHLRRQARSRERGRAGNAKLDPALTERAESSGKAKGQSRVIVVINPEADLTKDLRGLGGVLLRTLPLIDGVVVELPNGKLRKLAELSRRILDSPGPADRRAT